MTTSARPHYEEVAVGDRLPELAIDITTTFVVATAIASNDFMAVHHDRDAARSQGTPDIFTNILCDTGLVSRLITDWAGPAAVIKRIGVVLKVQNIAGDVLTMGGEVVAKDDEAGTVDVAVTATNRLGEHLSATVVVALPREERE